MGEPVVPPPAIHGSWSLERSGGCGRNEGLTIAAGSVAIGARQCRPIGLRAIGPARWYLDVDCGGDSLTLLDINRLDGGRLLVARRPLGEAELAVRCADGG